MVIVMFIISGFISMQNFVIYAGDYSSYLWVYIHLAISLLTILVLWSLLFKGYMIAKFIAIVIFFSLLAGIQFYNQEISYTLDLDTCLDTGKCPDYIKPRGG